jgi:hypothetical protein
MATKKKPIKLGSTQEPEPENPVAPPGTGFIVVGKAMYDEDGVMLIDEDGDMTEDLEEQIIEDAEENEEYMKSIGLDPEGNPLKD